MTMAGKARLRYGTKIDKKSAAAILKPSFLVKEKFFYQVVKL